ncbi:MAG: methyltransferase domain-containing protein [Deltaproteobacteria bacterium]|nr:methyltransferase domain-containing protein [Deltaproteobacteria bacterium]
MTAISPTPTGSATMSRAMAGADAYYQWIFGLVRPHLGRRVLELGTGPGVLTRQMLSAGVETLFSCDVDPRCVEAIDGLDPRLTPACLDLEAPGCLDGCAGRDIDTAVSVNVLEHIENDRALLAALARVLAPGGKVVLFVPAHMLLYGGMDRAAGHFRRYTRAGMRALLKEAGFAPVLLRYVNPLGFFGWLFTSRVLGVADVNAPMVNSQIRLFDRYLLPLSRLAEPFTGRLFGQSLLAVGRLGGR